MDKYVVKVEMTHPTGKTFTTTVYVKANSEAEAVMAAKATDSRIIRVISARKEW